MRRWQRLQWAIGALVLFFALGLVWRTWRNAAEQKESRIDSTALDGMLPEAVQWIQNFHRIEIKDGRKVWEVEGEEAQYLEENGQVLIRKPRASMFLKDGDHVSVVGGEGTLFFDGKDLQDVVLKGNVEIRFRDYVINAPSAVYYRATEKIVARGAVSIVSNQMELAGTNMVVYLRSSRMKIHRDVRVSLRPSSPAPRT